MSSPVNQSHNSTPSPQSSSRTGLWTEIVSTLGKRTSLSFYDEQKNATFMLATNPSGYTLTIETKQPALESDFHAGHTFETFAFSHTGDFRGGSRRTIGRDRDADQIFPIEQYRVVAVLKALSRGIQYIDLTQESL